MAISQAVKKKKSKEVEPASTRIPQHRYSSSYRQKPRSQFNKTSFFVCGISLGLHVVTLLVLSFFSLTQPTKKEPLLISSWYDAATPEQLELTQETLIQFDKVHPSQLDSESINDIAPHLEMTPLSSLLKPVLPLFIQKKGTSSKGISKNKIPVPKTRHPEKPIKPKFRTKFFGQEVAGKTVVFVLDISSSMKGRRHQRAVQELKKAIQQLKSEQKFSVVLYHEKVLQYTQSEQASGLIEASFDSKRRAVRWIKKQKPTGLTDPAPALEQALAWKPEVVVFFSDGELPSTILHIAKEHNHSRTIIHTLSFSNLQEQSAMRVLRTLASENGGQFHLVAR